jgi:DNA segregation ATPase FtsK/SpoIIIE-like protein
MRKIYLQSLQSKNSIYHLTLLSLCIGVLGGCGQSHQLGITSTSSGAELLQAKLEDPNLVLNTTQSISLVEHCAQEGERNAASALNKDAIAILGETGVGKSTCINHLIGCNMIPRDPEELGIQEGGEDVIVVSSASERLEATSIGHGMVSHTFLPKIIQDPQVATRVYLDFPGFSDNRGAEINIANAINIKRVLREASGVKAVLLANHSDFSARRGSAMQSLENACEELFGGVENLRRHKNSVLLGINRAPLGTRLDKMRTRCARTSSPIMQVLADRLFLYDPLERGGVDFWSRTQFLAAIGQMPPILRNVASSLFQTVLTDSGKAMLQNIVEHQVRNMERTLDQENYPAASRCWSLLKRLRIIGHEEITERIERRAVFHMHAYASRRSDEFREHTVQRNFTEAERLLASLCSLNNHFPDENLIALGGLNATLDTAKKQQTAQQKAEAGRAEAEERRVQEKARRVQAETGKAEAEAGKAEAEAGRIQAEAAQQRMQGELAAVKQQIDELNRQKKSLLTQVLTIAGALLGPPGAIVGNVVGNIIDEAVNDR